ncbi:MAG: choice-of-anchor D domain-containing protein [Candidatus Acetothermia bacterium]|jgi:hypothetical protein|nr:choice-of-anchor D domain-containing protein [Candidatus Acetothermia bacterium]
MRKGALGVAFLLVLALGSAGFTWAQESLLVVINEFGQGKAYGNGEWVELVVVGTGPCSSVDMRGWVFRDQQGDTGGGVHFVFQNQPVWASVPAGTTIVVYNPGATGYLPDHFPAYPDHDFDDCVVVLPANASGYFDFKRWDGLGNPGDSLVLLDDSGGTVDGISYRNGTGQNPVISNVGSTKAAWYAGDTQSGVNDSANWVVGGDGPGGSTPGAGNTPENTGWIQGLRPSPAVSVSPTSHDFGAVDVGGESSPLAVTVANTGCAALVAGTITLTGQNAGEFEIRDDQCSGTTIPAGESRTFQVVFKPASAGAKSATLVVPTSGPANPTVGVALSGRGTALKGDVDGDGAIALADVRLAKMAAYGLITLTPEQRHRADVDDDGDVDLEDAEATLAVAPLTGGVGEEVAVPITVVGFPNGVAGLAVGTAGPGGHLGLRYDPTRFQVTGVQGANGFQVMATSIDNVSGEVRFVVVNPTGGVDEGDVAVIVGTRVGPGDPGFAVSKANLQLVNAANALIPVGAYTLSVGGAPLYYVGRGQR